MTAPLPSGRVIEFIRSWADYQIHEPPPDPMCGHRCRSARPTTSPSAACTAAPLRSRGSPARAPAQLWPIAVCMRSGRVGFQNAAHAPHQRWLV